MSEPVGAAVSEPVAVALDDADIRLALIAYALPVARLLAGGTGIRFGSVAVAEGPGGLTGELSAVVEWERTDNAEGEADGPAVVVGEGDGRD